MLKKSLSIIFIGLITISCTAKKVLIKEQDKPIIKKEIADKTISNNIQNNSLNSYKVKLGNKEFIDEFYYFEDKKNIYFNNKLANELALTFEELNKNQSLKQELDKELQLRLKYYNNLNEIIKNSPNKNYTAYTEKNLTQRSIKIKNIKTNEIIELKNTSGNFEWTNDSKSIYYCLYENNPCSKIYKYYLETKVNKLIYDEKDPDFSLELSKTISQSYILLNCISRFSNEIRYIGAKDTIDKFKVFLPRKKDVFYDLQHNGNKFIVITNSNSPNYKLMGVNVLENHRDTWEEIFPNSNNQILTKMLLNKGYAIIFYTEDFLERLKVINLKSFKRFNIDFNDYNNYDLLPYENEEYYTNDFYFKISSLLKPEILYKYSADKKVMKKVSEKEVFSYNIDNYKTSNLSFRGNNGLINISFFQKKEQQKDKKTLFFLLGLNENDSFKPELLTLLDRNYNIAFIHLKGAENNSKNWYESEDINFKKGFINDIINSIDFSIEKGVAEKNNLYIYGEKSTALAIQVLLNKKPDFFKKVILSNPSSYIFSNQKLDNKKLEESILNYKIDSHPYYNIKDIKYPDIFINTEIDNTESIKYLSKIKSMKNNKSKSYLNIQKEYDVNKTFSDMYYFLLN